MGMLFFLSLKKNYPIDDTRDSQTKTREPDKEKVPTTKAGNATTQRFDAESWQKT